MRSLGLNSTILAPTSSTISSRSAWHSPVSYLFGGLAAMTGLIAFALLILACSYCHLAGTEDDETRRRQGDVEQGKTGEGDIKNVSPVFEDKFLVVMAGNHVPTFLATPRFTKASILEPFTTVTEVSGDGNQNPKEEEEVEETEHVNGHVDLQSMEETSSNRDELN